MDREQLVKAFFETSMTWQRIWREQFHARMKDSQTSFGQMGVLMFLSEKQPISSKALAELMHCSKSSIAQLIEGLDQQGFILRQPDLQDRRVVYLSLSKAGEAKLQEVKDRRREMFNIATEALNDADLATLTRIQSKMLQAYTDKKKGTE